MNRLKRIRVVKTAKQDARRETNLVEYRIEEEFGKRPGFYLNNNAWHDQIAQNLTHQSELNDLYEDSLGLNQARTTLSSPFWLRLGVLILLLFEVFACLEIVKTMGYPHLQQMIFAPILAISLFAGTHWTSKLYKKKSGSDFLSKITSRLPFLGLLSIYLVFIFSLAVARWDELSVSDSGTRMGELASLIITIAMTLGPAWLCELALTKLGLSNPVAKKLKQTTKQKVMFERKVDKSERFLKKLSQEQESWDQETYRYRALYLSTFFSVTNDPKK